MSASGSYILLLHQQKRHVKGCIRFPADIPDLPRDRKMLLVIADRTLRVTQVQVRSP